jgi:hypothetical protein
VSCFPRSFRPLAQVIPAPTAPELIASGRKKARIKRACPEMTRHQNGMSSSMSSNPLAAFEGAGAWRGAAAGARTGAAALGW